MNYKIIGFNTTTGTALVKFSTDDYPDGLIYSVDIPVVDGAYISGSALDSHINSFAPYGQIARLVELKALSPTGAPTIEVETVELTLDQIKANKQAELNAACQAQIYAGYDSDALGSVHHYPAKATDQANMVASVTSSLYPNLDPAWTTPFWCADADGNWAYVSHTATQIQKAGADGKNAILVALSKNAGLQAQVDAATTAEVIQSVTW